ncbi:MAG: hypothetical protein ACRCUS_06115 [Anaerovoracaceae bacterium]
MSKETEKVFRKFSEATKNMDFKDENELNDFLGNFMNNYNEGLSELPDTPMEKAYDLIEEAMAEEDYESAQKILKKAIKLEPNCLDAHLELLLMDEDISIIERKRKFVEVIKRGENYLAELDLWPWEEDMHFYGITETRPYMRCLHAYLEFLINLGQLKKSIEVAEKMIMLNEDDNQGVRYRCIILYAILQDTEKAMELWKKYNYEKTAFFLFPLLCLFLKNDEIVEARKYLKLLHRANNKFIKIFINLEEYLDAMEMEDVDFYQPGESSEVIAVLDGCSQLILFSGIVNEWIEIEGSKLLKNEKKARKKKK